MSRRTDAARTLDVLENIREECSDLFALVGAASMLVDAADTAVAEEIDGQNTAMAHRLLRIIARSVEYIGASCDDEIGALTAAAPPASA